jgi:hypothetical protein
MVQFYSKFAGLILLSGIGNHLLLWKYMTFLQLSPIPSSTKIS